MNSFFCINLEDVGGVIWDTERVIGIAENFGSA